ncbi:hypothetical protein [Aestuariivirga sp.]|uniref:hypothetical protein n=1 Tax=Aestuariivirga sp. TaxID=2650926 RepID=UPI0037838D52
MPRKSLPVGPHALAVLEGARIDLARAVLVVRDGENEPNFGLPEVPHAPASGEEADAIRTKITEMLSEFAADELQPAEQRCRRIRSLAEGKGVTSLATIAGKQLSPSQSDELDKQPDHLCRSIWVFLNARQTFEDAESFYFARQFRDYGKMYDAFEVELEKAAFLHAASVDETALAARITKVLQLKKNCTVKALDLPPTAAHPASIMLIVRHGGPLSSVYDHRDDGRRGTIYFRPPNEATLIYTPSLRQIEVCADSPAVRQEVAGSFADVALGHNVSEKPLNWKHYNLSRFRSSLRLETPHIPGYEIKFARVLEAEIRLGNWKRKLLLKVAIDDDIEEVAETFLKPNNVFRRADGFSRISIAVAYNRGGDDKERTLNITISGSKSCNLQSNRDPEERNLGFALLKEWGILSAFEQIDTTDIRAMFPNLVRLHDRSDDTLSGADLRELGLDPDRLIRGGLLGRCGRQDIVLLESEGFDWEAEIKPSTTEGMVRAVGSFGEDAGRIPSADVELFEINRRYLHETLLGTIKPLLTKSASQVIDTDLTLAGTIAIDGTDAPVYLARRLDDVTVIGNLDLALRSRHRAGPGVVLSSSAEAPICLGPNVVVPILSNLSPAGTEPIVSRDGIELAYRSNSSLARGGSIPRVIRSDTQLATLHVPGKDPLSLTGNDQATIFERLANAHNSGSQDMHVKDVMKGFTARSPQQAFRSQIWDSIYGFYIGKGAKRGYWRLIV